MNAEQRPRLADAPEGAVRPNMLLQQASATSSTLDAVDFNHCVVHNSSFANTAFIQTSLRGASLTYVALDGAVLDHCSLRGVRLSNCDVEGLVINGVRVGALLKAFGTAR